MPGLTKFLGGKRLDYFPMNFGSGNEYEVIDVRDLFEDMFQYDRMPEEYDLKRLILVGSQNSGKTVLIRSLVSYIQKLYNPNDVNAFMTNDIKVLELKKYRELWLKPIQICIIDDAIRSGIDSRRSMSSSNVDFTQRYFQIRHILEKHTHNGGVVVVILATQDLMSIDKRIRENAQCTIYKTYYRKKWFQEEMNYDEDLLNFIKEATFESLIRSNMKARECGIGVIQTGDIFKIKNKRVDTNEVPLKILLYESGKEELIRTLIVKLMKRFTWIFEIPDKFVKGYLLYAYDSLKDTFPQIKLTSSDYSYITRWGCYLQYQNMDSLPNKEINDDNNLKESSNIKNIIFKYFEQEKNFENDDLYEKFPEFNQSTLRNYKSEYINNLESTLRMAKKREKSKNLNNLQKSQTLKTIS